MSTCDIVIEFDRPNREYRGAELVSGTASIGVHENVRCGGIQLARCWRTHGRGNADHGEMTTESLSGECILSAGDTLRLPFSFQAPREPATYHGHYLSIDHYVKVTVDVPWALDPKAEENYVVLPGAPPEDAPFNRAAIRKPSKPSFIPKGIVGRVLIVVVGLLFLPLLLMLVPLLAPFVVVRFLYRQIIRNRIGKVTLKTPHVVVAPGEAWPLELHFTPQRDVVLDSISVRIVAQERCVSGGGKNKSTHTHTLYDKTIVIDETREVAAGHPHTIRTTITLPTTSAFSFDGSDNDLEWHAEVRIALPRYPDWKEKVELQMAPAEFIEKTWPNSVPPAPEVGTSVAGEVPSDTEPAGVAGVLPEPIVARGETGDSRPLTDALEVFSRFDYFGTERDAMIASRSQEAFECSVVVQQILSTHGDLEDPRLVNGRTIVGTISDTRHEVQLLTFASDNERNDALSSGTVWNGMIRLAKWDGLYNRVVLHEA